MKQTVNVCDVVMKITTTCGEMATGFITVGNKKFDICDHHASVGVRVVMDPEPKVRDLLATKNYGKGRVFNDALDGSTNGKGPKVRV